MPPSLTIRAINRTATLAAAALLGCSGGGGDSTSPPSGSLVISLGAPALSIAIGNTGTMTASVTRAGGFSDALTVSVSGLPAGVTVSANTQTTVGTITTASITLTVVSSASAGTSTVTVSASGAGVTTVSGTFTLTLTSAVSNQVSLNFAQCGVGAKPLFVAFQDGATGAWTRVTGTTDVYSFSITEAKGGYAYVTPTLGGTAHLTTVFLGTRAEVGAGGAPINICGAAVPPQRTITGTVSGMTPGQAAGVSLGGRPGIASPAFPNFTISSVPDGPHDLVAFRSSTAASAQDRGIIRQNQTLAHNTNIGTLDMNGAESFGLATANLTIGGASGGGINTASIVFLSGSTCDPAAVTGVSGPAATFLIIGVPDARMRATDMHQVSVIAGGSVDGARSATEVFHTLADRTIDLPPAFSSTVSTVPGTYKRLSAAFTLPPEYNLLVALTQSSTSTVRNMVSVTATVGWAGATVALVAPNFTGLTGWDDSWAPSASATSNWILSVSGSTQAAGASLCVAGTKLRTAIRIGQL